MSMACSSNRLGINGVIHPVATDEPNVDDAIGTIDPYHDAAIFAADVEHHSVFRTGSPTGWHGLAYRARHRCADTGLAVAKFVSLTAHTSNTLWMGSATMTNDTKKSIYGYMAQRALLTKLLQLTGATASEPKATNGKLNGGKIVTRTWIGSGDQLVLS